jgi:nitroreductase
VNDCPSNAIDITSGTIDSNCIHCGHCIAICPQSTISPDHGTIKALEQSTVSPTAFQQLTAGMRSCRSYLKKDVPEETIHALIENMAHYPSASNARPVKVTVVRSKEMLELLNNSTATILINKMKLFTSPYLSPLIKLFVPSVNIDGLKKYLKSMIEKEKANKSMICYHAPAVMLFHGPKTKTGMAESDALIWANSTSLYANTMGMGTCFNGFIVKAMEGNKAFKKAFNIPVNHEVYTSLLIGYPKVQYVNETSREKPEVNFI